MIKTLFVTTLTSASALASPALIQRHKQNFRAIEIPNANCGDGSAYRIHVRPGNPEKILFHFQHGGMCWSWLTCTGPAPMARLKEDVDLSHRVLDANPQLSDYTYVYFPYCTADIYAANHEARYFRNTRVKHVGRKNIEESLKVLAQSPEFSPSRAKAAFVYGESAGAIGALLNLDLIEAQLPVDAERFLLADSPGLHFSENIWSRLSQEYIRDISQRMSENNLHFDPKDGVIAAEMLHYCQKYPHWKIGVMQSSQDLIMSRIFGNMEASVHEALVYGDRGIDHTLADPTDRCASWTPRSQEHVFITKTMNQSITTADGVNALAFLKQVLEPNLGSFLSHR